MPQNDDEQTKMIILTNSQLVEPLMRIRALLVQARSAALMPLAALYPCPSVTCVEKSNLKWPHQCHNRFESNILTTYLKPSVEAVKEVSYSKAFLGNFSYVNQNIHWGFPPCNTDTSHYLWVVPLF